MGRIYDRQVDLFSLLLNHNQYSSRDTEPVLEEISQNENTVPCLQTANMSDSKVLPRMSTGDMNIMIVCFSAMIFVFFLAGVVYYTWKPSRNGDPAPVDAAPDTGAHRNLAHDNLARPFDGSTATHRVMIWSDAPRRDSNTGCRLPIFQRRRETSLERNTIPLQSVPGRENPRNNAE
ncbi:hypothetical protein FPOAC1_012785 [Fusarium poae]|uniref:hypothetical protein n=1 Tax=Fusarium poae TaxID=36050 RepID=UPI001CE85DB3|nr:hypothetical protein FPOAC1_012785 [Fusarium poae]KAG8667944.1 hypothetical protein FPOAC1_012785 [Fusarium poae]